MVKVKLQKLKTELILNEYRRVMCLSLLKNKFFLIGLLIYFVPPIIFLGSVFANVPKPEYTLSIGELAIFLVVFVLILFFYPVLFLIGNPPRLDLFGYCIIYYTIAYGFLYLYWRRKKRNVLSAVTS